jgi:predicted nucleic acid-binding protein
MPTLRPAQTRSSSTSLQPHEYICDTTPVRIFAVVGRVELLVDALGGEVIVPRQVLDPDDDFEGPPSLLSEIGRSERFFLKRQSSDEARVAWSRLAALRTRSDIRVVDFEGREFERYLELVDPALARAYDLAVPLGPGEAATIAIAEARGYLAVADDWGARRVLQAIAPAVELVTSRDLLRQAVTRELVDSAAAQLVYIDMLAAGWRGPPALF